ncbi:MAG: hypothetical protein JRH07_11505 [Deltaproteobacteria bacterium]|nr:hypothetical protein [Deltaproteobacteria bacterium]MBW2122458.1 hypothetical protein [Deltaproteobacteria bacterium]
MAIAGFQIQSIIRTYHRNIRRMERRTGNRAEQSPGRDLVEISVEGRKKQICKKAADQVIQRLTRAADPGASLPKESR